MSSLKNRIEKLKNQTSDVEVREVLENILEFAGNVSEQKLSSVIKERLTSFAKKDSLIENFLQVEKHLSKLNDMGISRALDKIKNTGVWEHNPRIQYVSEWYEKSKIANTPDFLIVEQFIGQMNPFCFDPSINEAVKAVSKTKNDMAEEIVIANTIHILENSRSGKFYKPLIENMQSYIENKSDINRSVLIAEMETYTYEPVIRNLQNSLKTFESNSNTSKFNITNGSTECSVNSVHSFVFVEKNADYFVIDNHYFKKVNEEVTPISLDAMIRINDTFVKLNSILNEENVTINKDILTYRYGNRAIHIDLTDKSLTLDGSSIKLEEINKQLLESGIFRWNQHDDLNKFNLIFENIDTLCEIDFAKTIVSNKHSNIKASIIRLGDAVVVIKNNPYMNENKVYTSMNGTQARDMILEFLNYDISESMADFLNVEQKKIQQLESERRNILNKIEDCQDGIRKIEESQNDILLSGAEEISLIKNELKREINKLKSEYAQKTNAIKSLLEYNEEGDKEYSDDFEDEDVEGFSDDGDGDEPEWWDDGVYESKETKKGKGTSAFVQEAPERPFNVGDQVEAAEYGVGKITSIDAAQKSANVIFNDGKQSKFEFPQLRLASQEEIQDEEEYAEDMSDLESMKKKSTTTFVQELPKRDFQVGETVNVIGKGIGRITAIDSIRHIAIVMLQNGQQSEEEFSNLKSQEAEIQAQEEDNYIMGIEMGAEPNMNEQPLESHTDFVEEIDLMDDTDIDENPDFSKEEPLMKDMEIARKWSSVPHSFKKYLDDSMVKDPYKYSPSGEDEDWDPEYSPLDSKPSKFMDTELDQEIEIEKEESEIKRLGETETKPVPVKPIVEPSRPTRPSPSNPPQPAEKIEPKASSPFDFSSIKLYSEPENVETEMELSKEAMPKVSFIVSDIYDGDLSGKEVLVDMDEYEMANENDAIEIEIDGIYDFVPKCDLIKIV